MPLKFSVLNGPIIAAGESLSDAIDCTEGEPVRITMPADWTPALLSFQISTDNEGFNNLHQADGDEVMINVTPGAAVVIPLDWARTMAFLKVRSGSADDPVPQEAQRDFSVALRRGEASLAEPEIPMPQEGRRR